ncbi:MAG TPA: hypothetical protein VEQ09_11315, partial [Aquabacterium sp.]|nr:hypothetical protein [Aquabacterium sp.]
PQAVSPIIMSTRLHDQSEDLVLLRSLIDQVYREQAQEARVRRMAEVQAAWASTNWTTRSTSS